MKNFYRNIMHLGIPIVISNLISSLLNVIDTIMISSLGSAPIVAAGFANQIFFFFFIMVFAVCSGSTIFVAQYWGKKEEDSIRRVFGFAVFLNFALGFLFQILSIFYPQYALRIFTKDAEILRHGVEYMKTVGFCYIITALSLTFSLNLRAIGDSKSPMQVSLVALFINIFLNYIFIYGKLGFQPMGIRGAALATVIARFSEFILLIILIYREKSPILGRFLEYISWKNGMIWKYIKIAFPVILNDLVWVLGQNSYHIAYGRTGTESIAAVEASLTVMNLFFVLNLGVSGATSVLIGHTIGSGKKDNAKFYANEAIKLTLVISICLGLIIAAFPSFILLPFPSLTFGVKSIATKVLFVFGCTFFLRALNNLIIVGILRPGGDTKFPMILETSTIWFIGVPAAFLGVYLKLQVHFIALFIVMEELVKILISYHRVKSGYWLKDITIKE